MQNPLVSDFPEAPDLLTIQRTALNMATTTAVPHLTKMDTAFYRFTKYCSNRFPKTKRYRVRNHRIL